VNARTAALAIAFAVLAASQATPAPQAALPPHPDATAPCVEVRIGQDSAGRLDCLNRALRAEVDEVSPASIDSPAAGAPADHLGQPTPAAVKQRMGNAYGRSVVPQRPPRVFVPPLPPVR
jgi:hypothetical protein